MTPTQTHLDLLQQLPDRVHLRLRQVGPGWQENKNLDEWPHPWMLQSSYQHLPASYWLPCDPTEILRVASRIMAERTGTHWIYDMFGSVDGRASVRVGSFVYPTMDHVEGDDPHEAALRLLLAVCGGEE